MFCTDRDPRGILERSWSESSNSTILLSTSELEKLIEDANESLDDMTDSNVSVVILHKENETQGLGLTVSGGIDQEKKEIMVRAPSTSKMLSICCNLVQGHSEDIIVGGGGRWGGGEGVEEGNLLIDFSGGYRTEMGGGLAEM